MYRIGFACKWIDNETQINGIRPRDEAKKYNVGCVSLAWMKRQNRQAIDQKLIALIEHNIQSCYNLISRVSTLDPHLKMVRLGSDVLPLYTHDLCKDFYKQPDVQRYISKSLAKVGNLARQNDVRLSFHPGQFCVLASDRDDVVERSLEEFEYHAYMAQCMGYGKKFQDLKINVHISGKQGPEGIIKAYKRLSKEARNCLTIENEEISHGLDECLLLSKVCPIVLDIHHHWIKTGEYIDPDSDQVKHVIDSWRDIRPVAHYSISREDVLVNYQLRQKPNLANLLSEGHSKSKLRAHSNFYWHSNVNKWAASFLTDFDLMCDSKAKNLASQKFYEQL